MSKLIVDVVRIDKIVPHGNADRLEIAVVKGWQVVVPKGVYQPGDKAVYVPIDAVLPPDLEAKLFPEGSKIKLKNSRVRTIKIRGQYSQGMLIHLDDVGIDKSNPVGTDVAEMLGISKYEPPLKQPTRLGGQPKKKRDQNPYFKEYTDIQHLKNFPHAFQTGERVLLDEKVHGTNFRAGWVPRHANKWWKKIINFFRSPWEFVYGSHHVQLQNKMLWNGFYRRNVYAEIVHKLDLMERIPKGYVVYGEIYGDGIQKNYSYGLKDGNIDVVFFDVYDSKWGAYLSPDMRDYWLDRNGFEKHIVPAVGRIKFPADLSDLDHLVAGPSILAPEAQPICEGVVVRSLENDTPPYKIINPAYHAAQNNTDYH